MSAKQRAEAAKERGNRAFGAHSYDEAIRCYTEAISIDSRNHVYFSNRSAAFVFVSFLALSLFFIILIKLKNMFPPTNATQHATGAKTNGRRRLTTASSASG